MSLSLTPETEQHIATQLAASPYQSADELILAGLQLLAQREQRLNELRQQINIGAEQIAQGKLTDGEVVFDRLFQKLNQTPNS
ncbi:MAG: type II toxin-antitoxin system ParD family antitoxin [Cyanobacteria bacterium P01_G01_bin.54]